MDFLVIRKHVFRLMQKMKWVIMFPRYLFSFVMGSRFELEDEELVRLLLAGGIMSSCVQA